MSLDFEVLARDGAARRGRIETARGAINTPAFMPVGTGATVKGMTPEAVAKSGAEIVLANAYHLMLRPGAERVASLGGLHAFMNWAGPILTDSGGFQIMSLAALREIGEDGVTFRSHLDGSTHKLTPERCIEIQRLLGVEIAMVLDECTAFPATPEVAAASMRLSLRWAERARAAFRPEPGRGLFGIVQGGVYAELRAEAAAALGAIGFEGYAIGGLAVGEGADAMRQTVATTAPMLPDGQTRYLMGVGRLEDIVDAVLSGIDLFDCVLPTRSGRTGQAITRRGAVNLRNARHADDPRPLDETCACPACRGYGRAYLHHLVKAKEILASVLLTTHNLYTYQALMAGLREAISAGTARAFAAELAAERARGDIAPL